MISRRFVLRGLGIAVTLAALIAARLAEHDGRFLGTDSLPPWEWKSSRELLTQRKSNRSIFHSVPGELVSSELIAWQTVRSATTGDVVQRSVVWWGEFLNEFGERRWVVTVGSWSLAEPEWKHGYSCMGGEKLYLVLKHPPRSADLRPLTIYPFMPVDASLRAELHVRQPTWKHILQDPPSLAYRYHR